MLSLAKIKKSFFFSATYDPYHSQFLKTCFGMPGDIVKYKSQVEISIGGDMLAFEAHEEKHEDFDELKKLLLVELSVSMKTKPIIVFMERKDENFKRELEKLCQASGTIFVNPLTPDKALQLRDDYAGIVRGVVLLDMEFGRSVDPKFGEDSEVLILLDCNTEQTYCDVMQMFGRGSRSQGHGKGVVYAQEDGFTRQSIYAKLKSDALHRPTEHFDVLRLLFKRAHALSQPHLVLVKNIFDMDAWKISLDEFANRFPEVHSKLV